MLRRGGRTSWSWHNELRHTHTHTHTHTHNHRQDISAVSSRQQTDKRTRGQVISASSSTTRARKSAALTPPSHKRSGWHSVQPSIQHMCKGRESRERCSEYPLLSDTNYTISTSTSGTTHTTQTNNVGPSHCCTPNTSTRPIPPLAYTPLNPFDPLSLDTVLMVRQEVPL
jgi:G3E family GTPase